MSKKNISKPYNNELVGKFVGMGLHHLVRRYGDDKVIKFPVGLPYRLNSGLWCRNLCRDGEIMKKYLSSYLMDFDVRFFNVNKKPSYVIIESFCGGRNLRKSDFKDGGVHKQFSNIINLNNEMKRKENISLDFFGVKGLLWKGRREVCNIMFDEKKRKLRIIDVAALHFGRTKDRQIIVSFITLLGLKLQKGLLKKFLDT